MSLMLKIFVAIVSPVLEYVIQVFIMAKQSAINRIEVVQRKFLRMVLAVPKHTRNDLVYAESGILPFSLQVEHLTVRYLAVGLTKPNPSKTTVGTLHNLKNVMAFQPKTWRLKAGCLFQQTKAPVMMITPVIKREPWAGQPILYNMFDNKTKCADLEELKYEFNNFISNHSYKQDVYYTDGSLLEAGEAGWAYVTPDKQVYYGKVQDHTPITLLELTAIHKALIHAYNNERYKVIVATDSKAAIQAIITKRRHTYRGTVANIIRLADLMKIRGDRPVLVWVPGHSDFEGNEVADEAAKLGATQGLYQEIEYAKTVIKKDIKRYYNDKWHTNLIMKSVKDHKISWYIKTSGLPFNHRKTKITHNRVAHTVRLLRMGVYQLERILLGFWHCLECDHNSFSIIHYLMNCSNDSNNNRTNLKQLLKQEEHDYKDIDKAAIILYRSLFINPEYINAFIHSKPYLIPKNVLYDFLE